MKKNRVLFTMCAVAALTACTDNELSSVSEGSNTGKAAIELTVAPEVETRGAWYFGDDGGQFKWNENDMIGLSMVSRDKEETITDSHYTLTNYQFTATTGGAVSAYPSETGYFTTKNATVFSGKYVAYYPYDNTYKDPSLTIPVSSPYIQYTSVASVDPEVRSLFAGDHSFAYSQPFAMEGGTEAKGTIKLQNLSGSFMLNLKADLSEKFGTSGISYIIATTGAFNLGQTKDGAGEFPVKGDLKSVIVTPSDNAATYDNENGFQEALILHMSTANKGDYDANGALVIGTKEETVYMVTLPRPDFFSEGYKFYLVDVNNKAYEIEKTAEAIAAVSGKYTTICGKVANFGVKNADVTETKVNGQNVYVAADGASLEALADVTGEIYIFNDIELTNNLTFTNQVELIAAKNQGKITVPAGKKLTFTANSTINTEVEVLGSTDAGLIADNGLTIGTKGKVTNNTPFTVVAEKQVVVAGEYTNNATFTVKAPAATTSEANRGLKVTGTFNNNGTVDNYGTVSNVNGKFTNEGDFLDEIGSKLSGTSMAQNGKYICIVDRQERLLEAINQRPSTTIRLKKCAVGVAGAGGTVAYDFQDNDWSKYDFEVVADNSSDYVRIQNSKPTEYTGTAKIKSLTVKVGRCYQEAGVKLEIAENLAVNNSTEMLVRNMLTVNGEVTTAGKFGIEAAASNLTDRMKVLGNFTIVSGGSATFNNNIIVRIFGADGVVNELGGSFVITDATEANKVPAIVYAKAFDGNGTWANYPTVVNDPENPYNN